MFLAMHGKPQKEAELLVWWLENKSEFTDEFNIVFIHKQLGSWLMVLLLFKISLTDTTCFGEPFLTFFLFSFFNSQVLRSCS